MTTKKRAPRLTPFQKKVLARARQLVKQRWGRTYWIRVDEEAIPPTTRAKLGGGHEGNVNAPMKYIVSFCALGGIEKALWLELGRPKFQRGNGDFGFGREYDKAYRKIANRLDWAAREAHGHGIITLNDDLAPGAYDRVLQAYDIALGVKK